MKPSAEAVYLDSSGLVKLVVSERESAALEHYLKAWPRRVTSALARVEVVRAVSLHGTLAIARARRLLEGVHLIQMDDWLLDDAAEIALPMLRSLDAIHLATARLVRGDLARIVTYDSRMAVAARAIGLTVDAPGAEYQP